MKPGELLISLLDGFYSQRPSSSVFTILEAGCIRNADPREDLPCGHGLEGCGWSTLYFAKWCSEHPGSHVISVELNPEHIAICDSVLQANQVAQFWSPRCGESVKLIKQVDSPIDFAYLDSYDDVEHGFAEFLACEEKGVPFVVMDDFRSKCLMAYAYSLGKGYKVERNHRFTIIELCNSSATT